MLAIIDSELLEKDKANQSAEIESIEGSFCECGGVIHTAINLPVYSGHCGECNQYWMLSFKLESTCNRNFENNDDLIPF